MLAEDIMRLEDTVPAEDTVPPAEDTVPPAEDMWTA